jgi:hypothetical protein
MVWFLLRRLAEQRFSYLSSSSAFLIFAPATSGAKFFFQRTLEKRFSDLSSSADGLVFAPTVDLRSKNEMFLKNCCN